MKIGYVWTLLVLALLFLGCCAGGAGKTGIIDAAKEIGSLGNLSSALDAAGLVSTLNNEGILAFGNLSFLVFAPNDAAFAALPSGRLESLKENVTELKAVLSCHIVEDDGTLGNLTGLTSIQSMLGESLEINSTDGLVVGGAKVLQVKRYDNGTIYVIDRVLMPEKMEVPGILQAASELGLKQFSAAIQSAGFAERLDGQGPLGSLGPLAEGPFTVFAPDDQAFAEDQAATIIKSANKQDLRTLLSCHVVAGKDLGNEPAMAKNLAGSSLALDKEKGTVNGAKITKAKRYGNGIIYTIDQVLIPPGLSEGKSG